MRLYILSVSTHVGANVGNSYIYRKKRGPPNGMFRTIKTGRDLIISCLMLT